MSPSSRAQGTGEDDALSLDFTKPAGSGAAPAAPAQPESKQELMLEPLDLPSLPGIPAAPAVHENEHDSTDSADSFSLSFPAVDVAEVVSAPERRASQETFPVVRLEPVVEQVARAYAEGHSDDALKTLEEHLAHETASERLWWMLFDLCRSTGAQELFDRRALEYAEKFEKSPPTWNVQPMRANIASSASPGGRASVTINGNLSERSASKLGKLREVACTRAALRIDVSRIKDADQGGCQLLLELVRALKNGTCELELSGAEDLASLIKDKLVVGQRADEAMWLLLLELYQGLGLLDSFEETAVNYAVTFEVSPPSWIAPKRKGALALSGQMLASEAKRDTDAALSLSGELLGADSEDFSALGHRLARAHPAEPMTVDLARLRRVDEKAAMTLRQTLAGVSDPRSVHLVNCSHLIAAMLEMAGVARCVVVETARL